MFERLKRKFGKQKRSTVFLNSTEFEDWLRGGEYVPLSKCPEVVSACMKIADLISTMTIHLMSNTDKGDIRLNNELSKHIDITPNRFMTRKTWMESIVMNMLLYGNGNSFVLVTTEDGLLSDLVPIPSNSASVIEEGFGYYVSINGVRYDPDELLHFVYRPDKDHPYKGAGVRVVLKDVVDNLHQASVTEKAFMSSKWKPSLIVKVDALTDEFSNPEGRRRLLDEYLKTGEAGEPWMIPAEQFSVEQIKPLTLNDLAIDSSRQLNKRTVAAIIGVPPFILGVGEFNKDEWNNFINNTIRPIAKGIEQELTRKLLISDKWYFKFNMRSLYAYDFTTISEAFSRLYDQGIVTGNEVRDEISLSPKDGLDELRILENYLPIDQIDKQKKVVQEE